LAFVQETATVYCAVRTELLGAFAKLRMASIGFVISCMSVGMEQLSWVDFREM